MLFRFGIRLGKGDEVVSMVIVREKSAILTVTELGFGKRSDMDEYRVQSRGGKGIINIKVTEKNGKVVGAKTVSDSDELMLISHEGMMVRCPVKDVRETGRAAQGVRLISIKGKDRVASVACVVPKEKEEATEPPDRTAEPKAQLTEAAPSPAREEPAEVEPTETKPTKKTAPTATPRKSKAKPAPRARAKPAPAARKKAKAKK